MRGRLRFTPFKRSHEEEALPARKKFFFVLYACPTSRPRFLLQILEEVIQACLGCHEVKRLMSRNGKAISAVSGNALYLTREIYRFPVDIGQVGGTCDLKISSELTAAFLAVVEVEAI
jgi:hypothetical protein